MGHIVLGEVTLVAQKWRNRLKRFFLSPAIPPRPIDMNYIQVFPTSYIINLV